MANADEYEFDGPVGHETLTRYNTALFTFLGESAVLGPLKVYNHVFIHEQDEETGETEYMIYIFQDNEKYDDIRQHIIRHNFPQHLNLTHVVEIDQNAFNWTHGIGGEDNTFPDDWNEPLDGRSHE